MHSKESYFKRYALNVAFIYAKSEKLLSAFLSTVRLTASKIKRTIATQIFTIVIALLSINGLLPVLHIQQKPTKTRLLAR